MPKTEKQKEMAPARPPVAPSSRTNSNRRGDLCLLLPVLIVFAYVGLSVLAPFWMAGSVDDSSPSTWPSGGGTTAAASMSVIPRPTPTPAPSPQPSPDFRDSVVILVALEDGPAGGAALVEWASSAGDSRRKLPPVWIKCHPNSTLEAAVRKYKAYNIFPFAVNRTSTWAETFDSFLSQNEHASLVGLFAEGSVPHPGLSDSIRSLVPALSQPTSPTAVLVRSRSRGVSGADEGGWFSDALVAQAWCNRAVLEMQRLEEVLAVETGARREQRRVGNHTLLQILPPLLTKRESLDSDGDSPRSGLGLVLVDGTNVLRSTFAGIVPPSGGWNDKFEMRSKAQAQMEKQPPTNPQKEPLKDLPISKLPNAILELSQQLEKQPAPKESETIRIGNSKFALVLDFPGIKANNRSIVAPSMIVKAPWPAMYVLETAASTLRTQVVPADSPRGLVLVTSVNCGYLDMAANLLLSVRKTTHAKILFVAMDEASFDFLDELAPGCTAMIPAEVSKRKRAVAAGEYGDTRFAGEVLVRPFILSRILDSQFAVLWTDSDMVWLRDPFPLLPDIGNQSTAEVALQRDGSKHNMCTCFLFLKPTSMARALVENWQEAIVKSKATKNQPPLQQPLSELEALGMRVDVISQEAFPAGKDIFYNEHLPNYTIPEKAVIVHNNWITGHKDKKLRFARHHLWYVDEMPFPDCGRDDDEEDRKERGENTWSVNWKRKSDIWRMGWLVVFCFGFGMFAMVTTLINFENSSRVREPPGRRR